MADNTSEVKHITALDFDITRAEQQLSELFNEFNRITNEIANTNWSIGDIMNGSGEFSRLKNEAASVTNEINNLQQEINIYNTNVINNITQVNQQFDITANAARDTGNAVDEMGNDMERAGQNTDNLNTHMNALTITITHRLINALLDAGQAAADAVKSTEESMAEISRVLELTSSETENMRSQMFGLGQDFGRSFDDVSAITLKFAQAGYDMQDSVENTKAMLLALNTAELDVENGTQSLIGILSQWGMEASELTTIIDKLNYTADNNAVTTQDLVDGLLKASSMAKTAGMSFDDTVGVLTAMKVASGAAGKEVGNAFKSIMAYIQRPESLKLFDEMGIEVYADKLTGELLPMMTILDNMTKKWNTSQEEMLDTMIKSGDAAQMMSEEWAIATDSLDEYTQYQNAMAEATDKANTAEARAQATAAAGVYRRNYYISLMENFTKATEISADLINAEGHSMEENSRYMETLTAKTEQLITALTELAVTAADAGLLDAAKGAIDAATAFTKWTADTKTLLPLMISLGGVMITINQNKIANGLYAAADALNNMKNAATGAAVGINTVSGAIGLAGTAISLTAAAITAIIQEMRKQQEEERKLREDTIAQAEADKEHYNNLNDLIDKYEEYSDKLVYTDEEKEELRSLTEQLTEMYGFEAEGIDLVNGKYDEQIEKLKTLSTEKLKELENSQQAALTAAQYNIKDDYGNTYKGDLYSNEKNTAATNYLDSYINNKAMISGDIPISFNADIWGGIDGIKVKQNEEGLKALSEVMGDLKDKGYANSEVFMLLNNAYTDLSAKINDVKQKSEALASTKLEIYVQEEANAIDNLTTKSFPEWEAGLLALAEDDEYLLESLKNTAENIKSDLISNDFISKIFDQEQFNTAKNELVNLSQAGLLTASSFEYTSAAHGEFAESMSAAGISAEDFVAAMTKMYPATNKTASAASSAAENIAMTDEEIEQLAKDIDTAEKNVSSINGYIQTLNEGNGLTAEQVLELCDTYGLLSDQFTLTENGYKIEISALEQLREAQAQEAIAARNSQIEQTQVLQTGLLDRLNAYGIEINSIANLAEAQEALAGINAKINENQYGVNGADEAAKQQELHSVAEEIRGIASAYEETEKLADGLYQYLGVSYDNTKKETDALKELTAAFDHLVDIGVYSIDEQIAYYEDLRRTVALTEEQYKSLESTLSKLYQEQLEEQKDAIKEQYEEQKQAIEDKYDLEKEALKKTLDDEMDARKEYWSDELDNLKTELNEQINTAKKVYEQKKKLTEKSHDSQLKSLETLRDTELANIKATYNAQIDALEKIKAARKSERDEEDYQNKRAELLEQISYYEQRTGTDAVEQLESLRKQLAELDRDRQRELEDESIDNQIDSLEDERDSMTELVKNSYSEQISSLKTAQETELDMYKKTYDREVELLKKRLETETKEMEKRRDRDLKRLEEEQDMKLKALEEEKDAAIKTAEDKWKEIQKVFNDSNLALIAAAGQFAPALYEQFHNLFTQRFELDLQELASLMEQLETQKSTFAAQSGVKPTTKAPDTSLITTIPSLLNKKNMASAATGGKTLSDGIAMLHKNELVVNAPVTKWLEEMAEKVRTPVGISPYILDGLQRMNDYYNSPRNVSNNYNNTSNRYSNDRQVVNNINVNAPLQNIEKIEDGADMEAAVNALERDIMRKVSTML